MSWHITVQNLEAAKRQQDALEGSQVEFGERLSRFAEFCREDVAAWCACSGESNMMKWGRRFYLFSFCLIVGTGLTYPGVVLLLRKTDESADEGRFAMHLSSGLLSIGIFLLFLSCFSMFCCTCHLNPVQVSKRRRFQGSYL
ncbi:hypothetical protein BOX15_Mlig018040g3 [Macrostomum lignano]|uniref:Uncharacterized protein n=2 Tax=Macrostomum lignano TaxID=282301 RepID=A0A267FQ67_9PLAT|nr:hypothetical protein BOX15_Mlig018040g3 [Macrostomum lignano]